MRKVEIEIPDGHEVVKVETRTADPTWHTTDDYGTKQYFLIKRKRDNGSRFVAQVTFDQIYSELTRAEATELSEVIIGWLNKKKP